MCSSEVEQVIEEGLLLASRIVVVLSVLVVVLLARVLFASLVVVTAARLRRSGALNHLVEFSTVEPDAAALRAVVDLDTLPLGHLQLGRACRTRHTLTTIPALADRAGSADFQTGSFGYRPKDSAHGFQDQRCAFWVKNVFVLPGIATTRRLLQVAAAAHAKGVLMDHGLDKLNPQHIISSYRSFARDAIHKASSS